jgi:hypothetical protein
MFLKEITGAPDQASSQGLVEGLRATSQRCNAMLGYVKINGVDASSLWRGTGWTVAMSPPWKGGWVQTIVSSIGLCQGGHLYVRRMTSTMRSLDLRDRPEFSRLVDLPDPLKIEHRFGI